MRYIIALIMAVVLVGFTVKPSYATFNICDILPWLPACNQEEPEYCEDEYALNYDQEGDCQYPEPEEESTPSAEVALTQGAEGCSQDCSPSYNPPVCNGVPAEKPVFTGLSRVSPTEVKVSWYGTNTEYYSLIYGYYGSDMVYGIPHINGDSFEVNIGQLEPNRAVNVQLFAYRNNCSTSSDTVDP